MHSWARRAVIVVVLVMVASAAGPARAEFGNCATEYFAAVTDVRLRAEARLRGERVRPEDIVRRREAAYLEQFDERIATVEYDCVERVRIPVATRGGTHHIRIIHDRSADWVADAAEFERGARAAAAAIGRLGGVDLEDVTLLLADDFSPREGADQFGNVAASAELNRDGECRVIVYLIGPAGTHRHSATAVAHEIFHCVQVANLSSDQMHSGSGGLRGGGDWWLEGSATWFAALALPDPGPLPEEVDRFDSSSATTPLSAMAYEASPFFLWLGQNASPAGVMRFLGQMASDRSESAQHAAMAAALPQQDWLLFAQDYLDGAIRHPHGTDIGFSPAQGDTWTWSATQTRTAPLEPFVLHRGVVAFECGRWRTSVTPERAHSASLQHSKVWDALPAEIDTTSGSGGTYVLAAINATPSRATLSVVGTMEAACGDCAGERELDACVIGSWQLVGGGSIEWMRNRGIPGMYTARNQTMTFRRDGTFISGVLDGESHVESEHGRADGQMQAQSGGRWSAREGRLNVCGDMQMLTGQTVITLRDGQRLTVPVPAAAPGAAQSSYTCSETSLRTELPMGGGYPPMITEYSRTGRD